MIFRLGIPGLLMRRIVLLVTNLGHSRYIFLARVLEVVQLTVTQLVKKFPSLYRTRRFITVFTRSRHWTL